MEAFNLTLADIAQAIKDQNIDLTAGSIKSETRSFSGKKPSKYPTVEKLNAIVIKASEQHLIRLQDIATVQTYGPTMEN